MGTVAATDEGVVVGRRFSPRIHITVAGTAAAATAAAARLRTLALHTTALLPGGTAPTGRRQAVRTAGAGLAVEGSIILQSHMARAAVRILAAAVAVGGSRTTLAVAGDQPRQTNARQHAAPVPLASAVVAVAEECVLQCLLPPILPSVVHLTVAVAVEPTPLSSRLAATNLRIRRMLPLATRTQAAGLPRAICAGPQSQVHIVRDYIFFLFFSPSFRPTLLFFPLTRKKILIRCDTPSGGPGSTLSTQYRVCARAVSS